MLKYWLGFLSVWACTAMAQCVPSSYQHRVLLAPVQMAGVVPMSWRGIEREITQQIGEVFSQSRAYQVRPVVGANLAQMSGADLRDVLVDLGRRHTAGFLVLPKLSVRPTAEPSSLLADRLNLAGLQSVFAGKKTADLPLELDVFDLRRGTEVDRLFASINLTLPRNASARPSMRINEESVDQLSNQVRGLEQMIACKPVSFPIVTAREKQIEIGAGLDLGIKPGDELDIALVKGFRFQGERRYQVNPIAAKATVTQVLPERAIAQISIRAGVLNLQRGDLVLAR